MVFSFFKKDKEPDEPKQQKPRPVQPKAPPAAPVTHAPTQPAPAQVEDQQEFEAFSSASGIEVAESTTESHSAIEEAAIYYANDRVTQAIACLVQGLKDYPNAKDTQPWLMLFDLYQMSGLQQKFEELAMEFVVKFERSPPAWSDKKQDSKPVPTEKAGQGNYFAFTGDLSAAAAGQFAQLQTAAKGGAVRLDLSKIKSIDADASRLMLENLQALSKAGTKIQYSGVATLMSLLKQAIEAGAESDPAHWLLLLQLYALQSKQAEFEDLAVEYAVTFEVSPPSWEQLAVRVKAEEVNEPAPVAGASDAPAMEGFVLDGVLSAASEPKLKELTQYAAAHAEVHIDMSQVSRVEFVSFGLLLNTLIEISQGGSKKVFIKGANEMINALFSVMSVDQFATIVRKTKR